MAITHIHPITGNIADTIRYAMNDKVESVKNIEEWKAVYESRQHFVPYTFDKRTGEVTYHTLNSSVNCAYPSDIVHSMRTTIENGRGRYRREAPRTKNGEEIILYHMWQNFGEPLSSVVANEIGRKLAEEVFPDFPVIISTHTNTAYTHNHFVVCAWNIHGKKWNDCHQTKRLIRSVSDRLCKEYGLQVLEHTKDMQLVRYQDSNGKIRYYEPTDRKNGLLQKRTQKANCMDNVGSYRHTESYQEWKAEKLSNQELVRRDIDRLLLDAFSYEHLLMLLREYGYTIRDKKKNGDWLSHISFTPPEAGKGVRDSSLSEDGRYTREQLTQFIENREKEQKQRQIVLEEVNDELSPEEIEKLPYVTSYQYGAVDIQSLHPKWRKTSSLEQQIIFVKRSEAERDLIYDLKQKDILKTKDEEHLLQEIQDGLVSLHFLETTGYTTLEEVRAASRKVWADFHNTKEEVAHVDTLIKKLHIIQTLSSECEKTERRIASHKEESAYMKVKYEQDCQLLEKYKKLMQKYNVENPEKMQEYKQKLEFCQKKKEQLQLVLDTLEHNLQNFEKCMKILEKIQDTTERGMEAERNQEENKTKVENMIEEKRDEERGSNKKQKGYER